MSAARIASAFVAVALLAACAAPGFAGGLTLRWDSCVNGGGVQNRSFACDVNTGTHLLVASFEPQSDIVGFTSTVAVFDVATAGASLPAWWDPTCRFSTSLLPAPYDLGASCGWIIPFPTSSGLSFVPSLHGPTTLRLIATMSGSSGTQVYSPGQEYSVLKLAWNNQKTVGTGSCAGCSTPACIVFNLLSIWSGAIRLSGPAFAPGSDAATWQGGGGVTSAIGIGCPAATPVRRAVWGSVKALYR